MSISKQLGAQAITTLSSEEEPRSRSLGPSMLRDFYLQICTYTGTSSKPISNIFTHRQLVAGPRIAMCGIFCAISAGQPLWPTTELQHLLRHRGPDNCGKCQASISITADTQAEEDSYITFFSTVLSLRGKTTVRQPLQRGKSPVTLCWNGEAWSINDLSTSDNDTQAVLNLLYDAADRSNIDHSDGIERIMYARRITTRMSRIAGPYAFVFHDAAMNLLFFGRDFLGRRSLLVAVTEDKSILISSISDLSFTGTWREIEADGFYCIDLGQSRTNALALPNMQRWGQFSVFRLPYHTATDEVDISHTAVGPPNPSMSTWAHGKVGRPATFIEQTDAFWRQFSQFNISCYHAS